MICDTRAGFLSFSAPPSTNGAGALVFHAIARTGEEGIYTSLGGAPVPVVRAGSDVDFVSGESYGLVKLGKEPAVNASGIVAFHAVLGQGSAILSRGGPFGPLEFVADSGEAFRSFSDRVGIDRFGGVLFHASVDPRGHPDHGASIPRLDRDLDPDSTEGEVGPEARWTRNGMQAAFDEGLFLEDGNDVLVVGGTHADFADVSPRFALSPSGSVVYRCWTADGAEHVVWDDGEAAAFDLARTGPVYASLGDPACNARGDVVFPATLRDGVPVILHGRNARVTPSIIARGSERISFRPDLALDRLGQVFFVAVQGGRETLILRRTDGVLRPLLRTGDPVPDRPEPTWVGTIRLSHQPILRDGSIALLVDFEPEGQAIVLLDYSER